MTILLHKALSYEVRGVLFDVYNALGPMLPERFYQAAVALGLEKKGITCQTEKQFNVLYRGIEVGRYFTDLWIENGKLLLELKVAPDILPIHLAQAISYLKVTGADVGFVVNFGAASLVDRRLPNFVHDKTAVFDWTPPNFAPDSPDPALTATLLEIVHRVHFELGPGFFHHVYRRAVMVELREQNINYEFVRKIPISYQNVHLGNQETRLLIVENKALLIPIAVKQIDQTIKNQLKARLKHLNITYCLIANFNKPQLETRIINTNYKPK